MNINDTLVEMLTKRNVGKITMGMSPDKKPFVALEHQVPTGPNNAMMLVVHQYQADSITECLNKIDAAMRHCEELRSRVSSISIVN